MVKSSYNATYKGNFGFINPTTIIGIGSKKSISNGNRFAAWRFNYAKSVGCSVTGTISEDGKCAG